MLLYNFNTVALTENNRPLPISENEKANLYIKDISCTFQVNKTIEGFKCKKGSLFLTNLRIIFVPEVQNTFTSFHIPLKRILSIPKNRIKFMCEDNSLGIISFEEQACTLSLFFSQIKQVLSTVVTEIIEDASDENVPLYFELIEN